MSTQVGTGRDLRWLGSQALVTTGRAPARANRLFFLMALLEPKYVVLHTDRRKVICKLMPARGRTYRMSLGERRFPAWPSLLVSVQEQPLFRILDHPVNTYSQVFARDRTALEYRPVVGSDLIQLQCLPQIISRRLTSVTWAYMGLPS